MNDGHHGPNCTVQSRILGLGEFHVIQSLVELIADEGSIQQYKVQFGLLRVWVVLKRKKQATTGTETRENKNTEKLLDV